jgi:hypothetical protein
MVVLANDIDGRGRAARIGRFRVRALNPQQGPKTVPVLGTACFALIFATDFRNRPDPMFTAIFREQ